MSEAGTRLFEELMRFRPEGLTANAWAVKAGVSRTIWADLKRHGNPSRRTLSKLLEAAGSSLAEFEALRIVHAVESAEAVGVLAESSRGWGQAQLTPLPLFSTRPGGPWSDRAHGIELITVERIEPVDRITRPPSLAADRDAYAVTIVGENMWPRFRAGRRVAVSPAAQVSSGDDVLVILAGNLGTLIGELQSQAADAIGLRQFNPLVEYDVPAADVEAVHKILGELI